jgi:phosphatidylserine decarboxylase
MMKKYTIPVAAEGWVFILPLAGATAMLIASNWTWAGFVTLVFTLFVLFFFRDPDRTVSEGRGVVVAPADGRVVVIKDTFESDYLKQDVKQISIFLSIFDVHVNRSPIKGIVEIVKYNPGKFHIASLDKASLHNEQTAMVIVDRKQKILVKQIAGIIARRIVCYAMPGDLIKRGERYGLIRFGSRVDIFLPKDAEIKMKVGDRVRGARDIIGLLK